MKTLSLALLLVGVGFANASPLRVTLITSKLDVLAPPPNVAGNDNSAIVPVVHITGGNSPIRGSGRRRPCGAMREKAIGLSNGLRNMLGLAPIEAYPFIGTLPAAPPQQDPGHGAGREGHRHHLHHGHHRHSGGSFPARLLESFTTLKWWEGGAVAFVFGCGIGVLLRLLWVMAVVSYRVSRGEPSEETYSELPAHDREEIAILIAPPQYTEKEQVQDEKKEVSPAA